MAAIDDAEAAIIAGLGTFAGFGSVSSWDTQTTVTTVAGLQTAIDTARAGSFASKTKITCNWDGINTSGSELLVRGKSGDATGFSDAGGALYIVAASGKTPAIGDQVRQIGIRGVHWHGIGFAARAHGAAQDSNYGLTFETNGTFTGFVVSRVTSCPIGAGYWEPGQPATEWITGVSTLVAGTEDASFEDCVFYGVYDAIKGPFRSARIRKNDFQQVIRDYVGNYSHTDSSLSYSAYILFELNTCRNHHDDTSDVHSDIVQTGTAADVHTGYRMVARKNIIHAARDSGIGLGGTQGFFNDDYLSADNQFIFRDNLIAITTYHGLVWFSPLNTRHSYFDRNTLARAGFIGATAEDSYQWIYMQGLGTPPAGTWVHLTDNIYATILDDGSYSENSGGIICDFRNTSIITDATKRPEAVFVNGASNFVRTGGRVSYTVPNETGTRAQFVAGMWSLFTPTTSGKGCPDLRSDFGVTPPLPVVRFRRKR